MRNTELVFADALCRVMPENHNFPLSLELHDHAAILGGADAIGARILTLNTELQSIPLRTPEEIRANSQHATSVQARIDDLLSAIQKTAEETKS